MVTLFPLIRAVAIFEKKTFTIYHLKGQHISFGERYPESFNEFEESDYRGVYPYAADQARIMAAYDNATRYNDLVLGQIIDGVKDECSVVVYAPDHGEEIFDFRDHLGRVVNCTEPGVIKVVHEVPLIIWMSDSFMSRYPEYVEMLKANRDKKIYNSDIAHTILDVAGLSTPSFRPDLSLLRPGSGRTGRKTLTFEYDERRSEVDAVKLRYE